MNVDKQVVIVKPYDIERAMNDIEDGKPWEAHRKLRALLTDRIHCTKPIARQAMNMYMAVLEPTYMRWKDDEPSGGNEIAAASWLLNHLTPIIKLIVEDVQSQPTQGKV